MAAISDQRGFALLEVLSAIFVLSICGLAVLYGITASFKNLNTSWQRLQAIELAQGTLEQITGLEYDAISSIAKTDLTETGGEFQYSVTVYNEVALSGSLKNISVTVYYLDPVSGSEKSVSVSSAKAKR